MKKNEIKSDLIHDKILHYANFITKNPTKFWSYVGTVFIVLLVFVLYSSRNENKKSTYNAYSSNNQNNYIEGNEELAIIGFDNILSEYSTSESYNQAFIYKLSYLMDNNNVDEINTLIDENNFSSKDDVLNYFYNYFLGNFYNSQNNIDLSEKHYNKSLKYANIETFEINSKCALINLYLNDNNLILAQKIADSVTIEDLSFQSKNKFNIIASRLDYLSK
tara:strand:- start:1740 stop:2399 length:660 start_codon:yes stop_codon:yes gene_type:complete